MSFNLVVNFDLENAEMEYISAATPADIARKFSLPDPGKKLAVFSTGLVVSKDMSSDEEPGDFILVITYTSGPFAEKTWIQLPSVLCQPGPSDEIFPIAAERAAEEASVRAELTAVRRFGFIGVKYWRAHIGMSISPNSASQEHGAQKHVHYFALDLLEGWNDGKLFRNFQFETGDFECTGLHFVDAPKDYEVWWLPCRVVKDNLALKSDEAALRDYYEARGTPLS